jgi:hypothetical protein
VAKYQQALDAMAAFQDGLRQTREAIASFRASLEPDPDLHDARYNLELAHGLFQRISDQQILRLRDAESHDPPTLKGPGQPFPERMREEQAVEWDADQRQGQRSRPGAAQFGAQLDPEAGRAAPDAADEPRGEVTWRAREAQQRARMCEAALSKTW